MAISNLTSILSQEFLAWISRNRITFIIVALMAANVYQYMDRSAIELQASADKKILTEQLLKAVNDATDYERRRSDKLEFLIRSLPNSTNSNTPNSTSK